MPFTSSKVDGTLTSSKLDSAFIDAGEDRAGDRVTSIVLPSVTNTSSIGSLTLSAPAVGTITLPSISSTSSANPVTLVDAGAGTFVVTDAPYSAAGDGVTDDTAAIQAAIDAAAAYASVSTPATVYFPPGTYKIIPPGRAYATIYKKTAGAWGSALASNISTDQVVDTNFHYMSAAPTSGDGANGDIWFDSVKGLVYRKAAGTWSSAAKMMDGSGTGWICQYSATSTYPTYQVVPSNSDGADGDYAIMYHVRYSNHGLSCFEINASDSYITFKGAGVTSKLVLKCFSDEDPDDYTVNTSLQTITATRIPGSQMSAYNQGSYAPYRGSAFVMKAGAAEQIINVGWENLWIDGGTLANGSANYYNSYDIINEWDTSHKGIVFTWDIGEVVNATVTDCKFTGFRGEMLYKGGIGNDATITISNTTFDHCNGSAVSVSGTVTVTGCTFTNCYNAVENHAESGQSSTITNTTITCATFVDGASNGIALIGDTASTFLIDTCTISNATGFAIYGADSLNNGTISNTTITSSPTGIKFNLATGTNLAQNYTNLNFTNVTFTDCDTCIGYEVNTAGVSSLNWIIDGCTCSGSVNAFFRTGCGDTTKFNPIIRNCTLSSTQNAWALLKWYLSVNPVVPRYSGNTYTPSGLEEIRLSTPGTFIDQTPSGPTIFAKTVVNINDYQLVPSRFQSGESIRIENEAGNATIPMGPNAGWNDFLSTVDITGGTYAVLTKNGSGTFSLTSTGSL